MNKTFLIGLAMATLLTASQSAMEQEVCQEIYRPGKKRTSSCHWEKGHRDTDRRFSPKIHNPAGHEEVCKGMALQ
jgi:hypothetical protein